MDSGIYSRVDEDEGSLSRSRVNPDEYQEKIERSADALWDCQTQYLSLQINNPLTNRQ